MRLITYMDMASIGEIYDLLGKLIAENPEVRNLDFAACGADSRLNIFRKDPDGPITGISLEDASYMAGSVEYAEELIERFGVSMSEQHKEFLIQKCCFDEVPDSELEEFVKEYGVPLEKEELSRPEEFCGETSIGADKVEPLLIYESKDDNLKIFYCAETFTLYKNEYCMSCASCFEASKDLKDAFDIEISAYDILACLYEKKFGIEKTETLSYLRKYEALVDRVVKREDVEYDKIDVPHKERDYGEAIAEEEMYANHDEVIGYYMEYYSDNPFEGWLKNTEGMELVREQDKDVTKTLQGMFGDGPEKGKAVNSLDARISNIKDGVQKESKMGVKEKEEFCK